MSGLAAFKSWPIGPEGSILVWVIRFSFCIYLFCPYHELIQAPCHGTRPHAGLRDFQKIEKDFSINRFGSSRSPFVTFLLSNSVGFQKLHVEGRMRLITLW